MKIFKYLFIFYISALFVSCDDMLDIESKSEFDNEKVFSDPSITEQFNNGIYQAMASDKVYRKAIDQFWYGNTDVERHSNSTSVLGAAVNYSAFAWNVSNNNTAISLDIAWEGMYKAIEICNLSIANIPKYSTPAPGNKMGALYAEALTMRAFVYYDLIQYFGDVPARFEPVNSNLIDVPISNRDIIYEQILSDLELAATYATWGGTGFATTIERPTKEAILAFYSRVALSYVGFSQRPLGTAAVEIKSTGANSMIARTVSNVKRDEYLVKVRQACSDVIAHFGDTRLISNYEDVFKNLLQNKLTPNSSSEYLWSLNYRSHYINVWSMECVLGLYTPKAPQAKVKPTPTFFFDFDAADKRRDVTCPIYAVSLNGVVASSERFHFMDITKINFGKFRPHWMATQFTAGSSGGDSFRVPIIRYSDVFLMYAEACLAVGDGTLMTGQAALDKVRTRAGVASVPLTLENIQKERAFEFAGERLRKGDLIRWGILKEKLDQTISRTVDLSTFTGDYSYLSHLASNSYKIYWRYSNVKDLPSNMFKFEIYGLKAGETDDKLVTDPTGGWSDVLFSATNSSLNFFVTGGAPRVTSIPSGQTAQWHLSLYNQSINPDEHQLLPIGSQIVEKSSGTIYNSYGY